jgi:hypothetical protein
MSKPKVDLFGFPRLVTPEAPAPSAAPATPVAANDDIGVLTVDDVLELLNKRFASCSYNSKFYVLEETEDDIIFRAKKDFVDLLANMQVPISDGKTMRHVPATKIWLEHPKRRHYVKVVFDPSKPFDRNSKVFNRYRGFAIKPIKGECGKFLGYVKAVLCRDNEEHFPWLMGWTSHIFQKPAEKPETAVAIQGEEEGSGKSFFAKIISHLLDGVASEPKLFFKTSNARLITGDFTGHLEYCLLVHAEEAFRAESEREDSILKDLITGDHISINPKGIQAKIIKHYARLILTGNPPHIVKASRFARRFLVLKISDKHVCDTEYFREILEELNNGGYEALMHYFMNYDISKVNLRIAPKTAGLRVDGGPDPRLFGGGSILD